jgi:hypothetical protein
MSSHGDSVSPSSEFSVFKTRWEWAPPELEQSAHFQKEIDALRRAAAGRLPRVLAGEEADRIGGLAFGRLVEIERAGQVVNFKPGMRPRGWSYEKTVSQAESGNAAVASYLRRCRRLARWAFKLPLHHELTDDLAAAIHRLVRDSGYRVTLPANLPPWPAPAGPVSSSLAADIGGRHDFGSGATANRQAGYEYAKTAPIFKL